MNCVHQFGVGVLIGVLLFVSERSCSPVDAVEDFGIDSNLQISDTDTVYDSNLQISDTGTVYVTY